MSADVASKIKEAEVCHSMGLFVESLNVYEDILSRLPDNDDSGRQGVQEKIEALQKQIKSLEDDTQTSISTDDLDIIKKALSADDNLPGLHDSANAFKELGLCSEAVSEYENLLKLGYDPEKFLEDFVDAYLRVQPADEVTKRISGAIKEREGDPAENAKLLFLLGTEMESRNHSNSAMELYQSASKVDQKNPEYQKRLTNLKASFSSGSRYDFLLNQKLVTTDQLKKALEMSKKMKKSVETILIEQFRVTKDKIGESLSLYYNCELKAYDSSAPTPVELIQNLKKQFLLQESWVPLAWDKSGVEVLVDDPKDLNKTDNIRSLIRSKIHVSIAIREDIEAYIRLFFDEKRQEFAAAEGEDIDSDFDLIPDISFEEEEEMEEDYDELDEASGKMVKLVDQVLVAAYRQAASDIHIEPPPVAKATSIRFRLDGVCQEYLQVPNTLARGILSRIKIMSSLDIAERRLPQDGKIKFKRKGVEAFELRVATLPTAGGFEDAVLRILAKAGAMKMDEMGLLDRNLEVLQGIIAKPYGLVLVVGPTGSGKTTSLHAALGHINKPGIKIWTAEAPVEITQAGLRQVEAKPKIDLDFARIMRAFLRADPDVIMIGEMRDHETASIGVEASLTGHLVFSTLHTNSAPETVTRLLDMGLIPLNFSDAFLGVMAQRLARRLCKSCKETYTPSEEEYEDIVRDFGEDQWDRAGIKSHGDLKLHKPVGCAECSNVGYKGRMGIHELMEGTKPIKRMIKKEESTEALFERATKEGINTLKQDGLIKAFDGITDVNEIRRICIN